MSIYKGATYTGNMIDYLDPKPEQICIEDIAKGLSQECRFGSQSRIHYSVATHSIMVCGFAPKELKLEALLHDAEEAYIKDLPSPLVAAISRGMTSQYRYIKSKIKRAIAEKFKLNYNVIIERPEGAISGYQVIREIDLRMAVTERNHLFKNPQPLFEGENIQPYSQGSMLFMPDTMIETERKFLGMYDLYKRD